ncbi:MAG: signal peptidase II [Lachnospiraceae bacterium]|nr:signal peptidase II [Lachnospiraceae bacterium]
MTQNKGLKLSVIYCLFSIFLIGLDQMTKILTLKYLKGGSEVVVIPKVLTFTYVENRGVAFGMLQNKLWLLIIIAVVLISLLVILMWRIFKIMNYMKNKAGTSVFKSTKYYLLSGCIILLISGAIGNLIDRIRLGFVVDFIYVLLKNLPILPYDFPVFNVADCYVTVAGIAIVVIGLFCFNEKELDLLISCKKIPQED